VLELENQSRSVHLVPPLDVLNRAILKNMSADQRIVSPTSPKALVLDECRSETELVDLIPLLSYSTNDICPNIANVE
jgi:hypothetical protein